MTIGSRDRGQYTLALDMSDVTIRIPGTCPRPELTTTIRIDDGLNPPLVLGIDRLWECHQRGGRVEYLKARYGRGMAVGTDGGALAVRGRTGRSPIAAASDVKIVARLTSRSIKIIS